MAARAAIEGPSAKSLLSACHVIGDQHAHSKDDHDQAAEILERIEAALSAIHVKTSRGKILIPTLRIAAAKYNRRDTPKGLLSKLGIDADLMPPVYESPEVSGEVSVAAAKATIRCGEAP